MIAGGMLRWEIGYPLLVLELEALPFLAAAVVLAREWRE